MTVSGRPSALAVVVLQTDCMKLKQICCILEARLYWPLRAALTLPYRIAIMPQLSDHVFDS